MTAATPRSPLGPLRDPLVRVRRPADHGGGRELIRLSWCDDVLAVTNLGRRTLVDVSIVVVTPERDLTYEVVLPDIPPGATHHLNATSHLARAPFLHARIRCRTSWLGRRTSIVTRMQPASSVSPQS